MSKSSSKEAIKEVDVVEEVKAATVDELQATIASMGEKHSALIAENEQLAEKAASFDAMKNSMDTLGKEKESLSAANAASQEEIEALKGNESANQGKIDLLKEKVGEFDSTFNQRVFEESNTLIKVRDHAKNVCPDMDFAEMTAPEIKKAVLDKVRPNKQNSDPKYTAAVFEVIATDETNKMTVDINAIVSKKHEDVMDYGAKELQASQDLKKDMWKKTG